MEFKSIIKEILFQLVPETKGRYSRKQADKDSILLRSEPFQLDEEELARKFPGHRFQLDEDGVIQITTKRSYFSIPMSEIPFILTRGIHKDRSVKGVNVRADRLQAQVHTLVANLVDEGGDFRNLRTYFSHDPEKLATLDQMQTYIMSEAGKRLSALKFKK